VWVCLYVRMREGEGGREGEREGGGREGGREGGRREQEMEKSTGNQLRYTRIISGATKCELIGKRAARAPRLEGRTACKY